MNSREHSRPREHDERRPVRSRPNNSPRIAAAWALARILEDGAFLDRIITELHRRAGSDPRDQNLAEMIVKSALERKEYLDEVLAPISQGFDRMNPRLRAVLYVGATQLLLLDAVPVHAAVSETVDAARALVGSRACALVNAVLRRIVREHEENGSDESPAAQVSQRSRDVSGGTPPGWLVERFAAQYGAAEAQALASKLIDGRLPVFARINLARISGEDFVRRCESFGVQASLFHERLTELYLLDLKGHRIPKELLADGSMTIQDASAFLVGLVVRPARGERILDMCAAPGGKATHLAELLRDLGAGEVVAEDVHAGRLRLVQEQATRLGLTNVICNFNGDTLVDFDCVLLDAPCSGSGVLGKKRDGLLKKQEQQLAGLVETQRELLRVAAGRIKQGGRLVYSTCSLDFLENEEQVAWFLENFPRWRAAKLDGAIPGEFVTAQGYLKVLPHRHGCAGGFAVCLQPE